MDRASAYKIDRSSGRRWEWIMDPMRWKGGPHPNVDPFTLGANHRMFFAKRAAEKSRA